MAERGGDLEVEVDHACGEAAVVGEEALEVVVLLGGGAVVVEGREERRRREWSEHRRLRWMRI